MRLPLASTSHVMAFSHPQQQQNRGLGVSEGRKIDWKSLFSKGYNVNVLSAARFFLFGSRDVWFEIGLPLFLRVELGWKRELVGLILAGMICLVFIFS